MSFWRINQFTTYNYITLLVFILFCNFILNNHIKIDIYLIINTISPCFLINPVFLLSYNFVNVAFKTSMVDLIEGFWTLLLSLLIMTIRILWISNKTKREWEKRLLSLSERIMISISLDNDLAVYSKKRGYFIRISRYLWTSLFSFNDYETMIRSRVSYANDDGYKAGSYPLLSIWTDRNSKISL